MNNLARGPQLSKGLLGYSEFPHVMLNPCDYFPFFLFFFLNQLLSSSIKLIVVLSKGIKIATALPEKKEGALFSGKDVKSSL